MPQPEPTSPLPPKPLPLVLWDWEDVRATIPKEQRKVLKKQRYALRRRAKETYRLQLRVNVARRRLFRQPFTEIAKALGVSATTCSKAYRTSEKRFYRWYARQSPARKARIMNPSRGMVPVVKGTVIESPDTMRLKREILDLRKRALPYDYIADQLGITPEEAKSLGRSAIQGLGGDEINDIELAKRLQIEQIDAMIAGIYPKAINGMFEAIDRMVKLLDAKAKLLGLNAATKIDIENRLVIMADQMGADIDELREIAKEVIAGYPRLGGS